MRTPGRRRRRSLGIWPLRPAKRIVWFLVAGLFAPVVLVALTVAVSAALGWVKLDLAHFSGFAEMNAAALHQGTDTVPPAEIGRASCRARRSSRSEGVRTSDN